MFASLSNSILIAAIEGWIIGLLIVLFVRYARQSAQTAMEKKAQEEPPFIVGYCTQSILERKEGCKFCIQIFPEYLKVVAVVKSNFDKNPFIAIPYEKLRRFELCGEVNDTVRDARGLIPLNEIPGLFMIEYEDEQNAVCQLYFTVDDLAKEIISVRLCLDSTNVFKLAEQFRDRAMMNKEISA